MPPIATMDGPTPRKAGGPTTTESNLNAVSSPNYGRLAELITLRGRLPEKQLLHPKKHHLEPDEQSTEKKWSRDPNERENAVFLDNCRQRQTMRTPARKALLNSIHMRILDHSKRLWRNLCPMHRWTDQFVAWASMTTNAAVRLRYSTINKHAFEKLYGTAKGHVWFNADGSNLFT